MLEGDRQGADQHEVDRYKQGGVVNPNIRSRFVAREIAHDKDTAMFAATPPLEAHQLLYSLAATEGVGYFEGDREGVMCLMCVDIKRAFFNANARRAVYVVLPPEDAKEGMCGRLLKSLYGTRDAARNWEEEYSTYLQSIRFLRGISPHQYFTTLRVGFELWFMVMTLGV